MERNDIAKKVCKRYGFTYKGDMIESMEKEDFHKGCIRFNIPAINDIKKLINNDDKNTSCNGETCFVWLSPENIEKYKNNNFYGELPGILVNEPIYGTYGLIWGLEIIIKCNGDKMPIISPKWVMQYM